MSARGLLVALFGVGVLLGGCMQSTIEPASEANLTAARQETAGGGALREGDDPGALSSGTSSNITARKRPARS